MTHFSASVFLFLLFAFVIPSFTVSALNNEFNQQQQFLTKSVSRVEETVHKLASILGLDNNSDAKRDAQPKIWAVLVAGSNGYYNYRHQVTYFLASSLNCFYFNQFLL